MKNKFKFLFIFGIISLGAFCIGCAGARGKVRLEELNNPVSMSPYLYDAKGQLISVDKGLVRVGGLYTQKTYYGVFYTAIRLTGDGDLTKEINDAVTALNADGIINFHYVVDQGNTNGCVPLTWLPIWPGTTKVVFFGDIVKIKGGSK